MLSRTSNIGQVSAGAIKKALPKVHQDLLSFNPEKIRKAPDRIAQLKGFPSYRNLKMIHHNMRLLCAIKDDVGASQEKIIRQAIDQLLVNSPENYLRQPHEYLPIEITMRLLLGNDPALKGLQLASNYGPYLFYLKERRGFTDFVGIDIDHHAVQYAREIGSPVIEGTVNPLPFEGSSFDLVMSSNFLVADYAPVGSASALGLPTFIRNVAAEVHRVLKPGGYFISFDEWVAALDRIPFEPPQVYTEEAIAVLPSLKYINVFQKAA